MTDAPKVATGAAPEPLANMGRPEPRLDGRLKVTGQARYAADFAVPNAAHAFLVTSAIARGRIRGFDLAEAEAVPGVLHIMTHQNRGPLGAFKFFGQGGEASSGVPPLASDRIAHDGEIIGMVIADSYEAAREAAYRVRVAYEAEEPTATLESRGTETKAAAEASPEHEDPSLGDAAAALATADIAVEAEYRTPAQHHNAIELFSTTCLWHGDELTVYEPSQWVVGMKHGLARQLGIEPGQVRVQSPFVGGAFGSKGALTQRTALVALAARRLGRPVKLVVTRDQGFTIATYRAETRHRVRLGATRDGRIQAYQHEGWELSSRPDDYVVGGTKNSAVMYASPNIATKVYIVKADRNTPGFMRSPPEVPYMFALEAALDELAVKLGMDPVELRRVNDTDRNPVNGVRYTSRSLMACYDQAAEAFGWKGREPEPRSMRDGDWLVGWGCATASYPTQFSPAAARVRLTENGSVRVQIAAHDVGTGAYTVIGQTASEILGSPMHKIDVELGDSELPPGPVAGGSVTTASACSAVQMACEAIRDKLVRAKAAEVTGATGADARARYRIEDGRILGPNGDAEELAKAFERLGVGTLEEYAEFTPKGSKPGAIGGLHNGRVGIIGGPMEDRTMFAFGAEFVEVRVHARTGEIRVPRITGAFAGGRIMNPRTARSQYLGGLIWGISSALHEATEIDERAARYVNDNIAEYLIPVNADIAKVEIILVPEVDAEVNPAGIKGIGELANVGTAAAVANAVYHATGKRIRELPIRIEDMLGA
jgi:xanthine dehydrogenase YagR molybdenum-binding subunit